MSRAVTFLFMRFLRASWIIGASFKCPPIVFVILLVRVV